MTFNQAHLAEGAAAAADGLHEELVHCSSNAFTPPASFFVVACEVKYLFLPLGENEGAARTEGK